MKVKKNNTTNNNRTLELHLTLTSLVTSSYLYILVFNAHFQLVVTTHAEILKFKTIFPDNDHENIARLSDLPFVQ